MGRLPPAGAGAVPAAAGRGGPYLTFFSGIVGALGAPTIPGAAARPGSSARLRGGGRESGRTGHGRYPGHRVRHRDPPGGRRLRRRALRAGGRPAEVAEALDRAARIRAPGLLRAGRHRRPATSAPGLLDEVHRSGRGDQRPGEQRRCRPGRAAGDLLDAREESFDRVLGINLKGPYFLTQAVAPGMLAASAAARPRARHDATIVFVTSVSATVASTKPGRVLPVQGRAEHGRPAVGGAPGRGRHPRVRGAPELSVPI